MPLLRILTTLLIALALVAGGVSPGFAHQEMHPEMEVAAEAPCHGMDGEPVAAASDVSLPGDCCDGGDCRCDCLQQTPGSVLALRSLMTAPPEIFLADLASADHAPTRSPPATRPPIA